MNELSICLAFSLIVCALAIWFVIDSRAQRTRDRAFWDAEWAKSETERARLREMVTQQHQLLLQKRVLDGVRKPAQQASSPLIVPVNGSSVVTPRRKRDPMILGNDDNTEG